jgi:hypothetical protein
VTGHDATPSWDLSGAMLPAWLLALAIALPGADVRAQTQLVPVQDARGAGHDSWQAGKPRTRACLDSDAIAGAEVRDRRTVDVILRGGRRFRLLFAGDCPQLGYYGGMYYRPRRLGQLCAGRDNIMSRAGGSCRIRAIAPLTPAR